MNISRVILFLALIVVSCSAQQIRNVLSSAVDRSVNTLKKQFSRSSSTTTTTTTDSSISSDVRSSENVTDSKGILNILNSSKETLLNKTGSVVSSVVGGSTIKDTISTFLFQTDTCFGKVSGWDDPELGNFTTTKDSPYCDSKCARNFFCCAPFKPDQADVKFIYSNDRQDGRPVTPQDTSFRDELRQSNRPLAFIVHGFLNNYQFDSYFNETRDGLVKKGFNVIVVDWARANRLYLQSIANVRIVGALVGHFIKSHGYAEKSTCIGFSLGSHICGEAGKWLRERQLTLAKCHGIDPAGPAFDGCGPELRLDPTDCGVVTAVHTSGYKSPSSILKEGLGTSEKTGHCDFWVNNGFYQPNCDNGTLLGMKLELFKGKFGRFAQQVEHSLICSHGRAMYYLVSHVRGACHFTGKAARNCGAGRECQVIRVQRSTEYDEDASTTRHPHGYSYSSSRPSYSSQNTSRRPQQWNQGQRPSYSTENTNDFTTSYNKFTRATATPDTWIQGQSSQNTYSTRKPDLLIASGSENVNTWESTTARPSYGNNVYSSTTSYDNAQSNDDVSHGTLANNHNSDNDRGTTSRPYRGTFSSTSRPYDEDEYSSHRPSTFNQANSSPSSNVGSSSRPSNSQTSSFSSYSAERPANSGIYRPESNQNTQNKPGSGLNQEPSSNVNSNSNFNRPNQGTSSYRPGGSNSQTGDSFPSTSFNSRPPNNNNNQNNVNSGNNNQQGTGTNEQPYRPGNNFGMSRSSMAFPPDDHCTSDMNIDYYVVTSGYEPYC